MTNSTAHDESDDDSSDPIRVLIASLVFLAVLAVAAVWIRFALFRNGAVGADGGIGGGGGAGVGVGTSFAKLSTGDESVWDDLDDASDAAYDDAEVRRAARTEDERALRNASAFAGDIERRRPSAPEPPSSCSSRHQHGERDVEMSTISAAAAPAPHGDQGEGGGVV